MLQNIKAIFKRDEPSDAEVELRLEIAILRKEIQKSKLESQGLIEESTQETQETQEEKPNKTKLVEQTSMTINFGKSNQGRKDWFVTGKTFTSNYDGWNTARTKLFLIGSGGMSETQFKKELKSLIKNELDGFKLGGRIKGV